MGAILSTLSRKSEAQSPKLCLESRVSVPSPAVQTIPENVGLPTTSSAITAMPSTSRMAPSGFRFLDLPADIRLMIYEEIVVVGKVFYTPSDHDLQNGKRCRDFKRFRKPDLSLLRVCKQMHREAEAVYFSKNLFVLPVQWACYHPFGGIDSTTRERYLFSKDGLALIKNVSLTIDQEHVFQTSMNHDGWEFYKKHNISYYDHITRQQRYEYIHEAALDAAYDDWARNFVSISRFKAGLRYLEMDFTNAFCPSGCCRPHEHQVLIWDVKILPKSFDVIGLRDGEQPVFYFPKDIAHTTDTLYRRTIDPHFRGPDEMTKWDMWKV